MGFNSASQTMDTRQVACSMTSSSIPYYASEVTTAEKIAQTCTEDVIEHVTVQENSMSTPQVKAESVKVVNVMKKKKNVKKSAHKKGVFSPVVIIAKKVLGDQRLKKVRANVISMHSSVINRFVDTSDTRFGRFALKLLFSLADKNNDGKLDEEELNLAFKKLGFSWLKEKQVYGILKRTDVNNDGTICKDEFEAGAPKTLRTNLAKLAKKNGEEMGPLS